MDAELKKEQPFKIGQIVKCIVAPAGYDCGLRNGAIYTVRDVDKEFVEVASNNEPLGYWEHNRFVPVTGEPVGKEPDKVYRPLHYTRFEIEPIYFIMKNNLPFAVGNVIKYVCRYDAKEGVDDLRKAQRYLEMLILKVEGNDKFAE